ncbi:MAG: RNA polymerase sigma factor [Myxococcales bacterium]|nr:RNA polymerase sigma factor [Myxococcales bacterium]
MALPRHLLRPPAVAAVTRLDRGDRSDEELVVRARGGDRWAAQELFRRHVGPVSATATRLLGDPVAAEDVVQDAFAIALERLESLRDPPAFRSWIVQIAVSQVHRVFRRRRFLRFFEPDLGPGSLSYLASDDVAPDVRAELELVDRELKKLPAEQRIAWMLRYVEGMELREVADACDCSLATAKRRIDAAHTRIRRHVGIEDG